MSKWWKRFLAMAIGLPAALGLFGLLVWFCCTTFGLWTFLAAPIGLCVAIAYDWAEHCDAEDRRAKVK